MKMPWKSQGNSGNLVSQQCGHLVDIKFCNPSVSFEQLALC